MADSFSDSGMRDTASATRADVGSDALQKGSEVNGARVQVSGTPAHDARSSSRAQERARSSREGRDMEGEGEGAEIGSRAEECT